MPTKPTATTFIRANLTNYEVGVGPPALQGTATKIMPPLQQINNGWQADQKPPAQWENYYTNTTDQYVEWVSLGSVNPDLDAHIVETNSDGFASIAVLQTGNTAAELAGIIAKPNTGGGVAIRCTADATNYGAVFQSAFENQAALEVSAAGTPETAPTNPGLLRIRSLTGGANGGPVAIDAEAGTLDPAYVFVQTKLGICIQAQAGPGDAVAVADGGAAIQGIAGVPDGAQNGGRAGEFDSNQTQGDCVRMRQLNAGANGDVLVLEGANRAICLKATQQGGKRPAAELQSSEVGSDRSAPLRMVPQTFSISGEGVLDGSYWHQQGSFTNGLGLGEQHHPRFYGNGNQNIWWTLGPTCAIDVHRDGIQNTTDSDAYNTLISAEFPDKMTPITAGTVIITVSGRANRTGQNTDIVAKDGFTVQIRDITAGAVSIIEEQFDLPPKAIGTDENTLDAWFSITKTYTLPAAGAREFDLRIKRNPTGPAFGGLSVNRASFSVRPLPSAQDFAV